MAAYIPPGWPTGVHPPASEGFTESAVAWLFEVVPPDYRLHGVLRRHPAALAALARHHTAASVEGARQGYRTVRTELAEKMPPHAVDAVLAVYRTEGRRLATAAKAVELVERALNGERFTAKFLSPGPNAGGRRGPQDHGNARGNRRTARTDQAVSDSTAWLHTTGKKVRRVPRRPRKESRPWDSEGRWHWRPA
jgi:hypothetical protein